MKTLTSPRRGWRDTYRYPIAWLVLLPLTARNYRQREQRLLPDKWYWADELLLHWGFGVKD